MWLKSSRFSQQNSLVCVNTSSGSFTCVVNLLRHPGSDNFDVLLGQDWFNFCTTAFQDQEGTELVTTDGHHLVFDRSPLHAVFTQIDISECIFCSVR
jgi:hypothetical protein